MKEVGLKDDPNLSILKPIVDALGELCESLVVVGGCATGLLLTAQRAQVIRATKDVDVVVQVASLADYHGAEKEMSAKGFRHDLSPDAPICRWVKDGIELDLMPSQPGILGFHNRWYPLAIETAERVRIPGGAEINLITAPVFIATKLVAFHGRGDKDYLASHDLEDLIAVIDSRKELIDEVKQSAPELREYIGKEMKSLLDIVDFQTALPGQLPADAASQARLPQLMSRLKLLTELD